MIFTVLAGTASILSYVGTWPRHAANSDKDYQASTRPSPEKRPTVSDERREELAEASIATNSSSFSPVTMQDFFKTMFDSSLTSIQHEDFLEHQLGRTVVWRGYVSNVSASAADKSIEVSLVDGTPGPLHLAFLKFSVNDRAQLLSLKPRQEITIAGVLEDFDGQAHLEDCRMLKVFPITSASSDDGTER